MRVLPGDRQTTAITWLVALLVAALFPVIVSNPYTIHATTLFLMYAVLAMGLSIVVSHAGLLDLGYVAFFAVGAYFYAILNRSTGLSFAAALPLAGVLAAGTGVLLGFPTLRVRGDYLALVTLAFGEMVRQILQNWTVVTGGPRGISAVDAPHLASLKVGAPWQYYYLALVITAVAVLALRRIDDSPVARVWGAIRDEEIAARVCGINSTRWLLLAFAVGASFAGIVGVLFAAIQRFVSPETFVLDESILVLAIVVLSGGRSLPRLFLATAILYGAPEVLRDIEQYRALVFGLLLVVFTVVDHRLSRRKFSQARGQQETPSGGAELTAAFPEVCRSADPPVERVIVSGVEKSFSGIRALASVSFDIPVGGRIVALVGPNGAGKTTLFNCMTSLERVDSGSIELTPLGSVCDRPPYEVTRLGVARSFQKVRLFDSMTVRENVEVGAYCRLPIPVSASLVPGLPLRSFQRTSGAFVDDILVFLGLEPLKDCPVNTLPIGIRRKVEIARALATRPRILLLDEIASGLNDGEKKEMSGVLELITSTGRIPILLVEHDMKFVRGLADHVVVLESGRVLAEGAPDEVLENPAVVESYLGTRGGADAGRE